MPALKVDRIPNNLAGSVPLVRPSVMVMQAFYHAVVQKQVHSKKNWHIFCNRVDSNCTAQSLVLGFGPPKWEAQFFKKRWHYCFDCTVRRGNRLIRTTITTLPRVYYLLLDSLTMHKENSLITIRVL